MASIDDVTDITPRIQYTATASQTAFDYPFPIFAGADLVVDVNGIVKTLTTDYSVSGAGDETGGTVTFGTGLTAADVVTIYRDTDIARTSDYQQGGPLSSTTVNNDLDKLIIICQELKAKIGRCIRFPFTAAATDTQNEMSPVSNFFGKFLYISSSGVLTAASALSNVVSLTADVIGALINPITDAEEDAGFTSSTLSQWYKTGDARRYKIVPNDTTVRSANVTALNKLISATGTSTFKGRLTFPNTTGSDTYYFDDIVQVKDGIYMDLDGCTLDFAKTYESTDDFMGFLTFIRDVVIENGTINIDYDGTGGTNAGNGLRIGSRSSYPFGSFTSGIEDEDLTTPMGNIALRNLRIITNNPVGAPIVMLGGIEGLVTENLNIDGQDAAIKGFYYEFGFYHRGATAADHESSHARNLTFINTTVKNLDITEGSCFELAGAMNAVIDGLHMDTGFGGLVIRSGEALFYNVGDPYADMKPQVTLRNINGKNLASNGITLQAAEAATGGYLATVISALDAGEEEAAQTDLISFSLDGFSIDADGAGIFVSGPCVVKNGSLHGVASSGQLIITDECVQFNFDSVKILGSSNVGVRASFGNAIWGTARLKIGSIRNSLIAGNTGAGVSIGNSQSVLIENTRIGYNALYDAAAESTQTIGVSLQSTAAGVVCRGDYVTTSAGAVAYANAATGSNGCSIENARGTTTSSGTWKRDGIDVTTGTNLADKDNVINTTDKYLNKLVIETSNDRLYFALGSAATDGWRLADGSATVTPA